MLRVRGPLQYDSKPPTLEYSFKKKFRKIKFRFRWVDVPKDFEMPFLFVHNLSTPFRLEGTTEEQEWTFKRVKHFYLNPPSLNIDLELLEETIFTNASG